MAKAVEVNWTGYTAEAKFVVDDVICGYMVDKRNPLPEFKSAEHHDVSWQIEIQFFGSWDEVKVWLRHSRETVRARVYVSASQKYPPKSGAELVYDEPFCDLRAETKLGEFKYRRMAGNTLTIYAKILVPFDEESQESLSPRVSWRPLAESSVCRSLGGLLDSGLFSDFLLCAEGEEFPVHRSILAARSEYFKAMFSSNFEDSLSGRVDLKDMQRDVLKQLLRYMYTGALGEDTADSTDSSAAEATKKVKKDADCIDCSMLVKLLVSADKHLLTELREECERLLVAHLRHLSRQTSGESETASGGASGQTSGESETATGAASGQSSPSCIMPVLVDVLTTGYRLDCEPLRLIGLQYISRHRKEVLESQEWKDLADTDLPFAYKVLLATQFIN